MGLVSGDQRVQVAKRQAQQNHALLERELQRRKEQLQASAVLPGVRIKEEPMSEEGEDEEEREAEDEEEPMDTSPSGGLHGGLANGLPAGRAAGGDSFNGHPPSGSASTPVARELRAFVQATFQKHHFTPPMKCLSGSATNTSAYLRLACCSGRDFQELNVLYFVSSPIRGKTPHLPSRDRASRQQLRRKD